MRALERLAPLVKQGMVLGLDAMRAALAASGDPQSRIPAVHIAGTNGKGSVSATIDAVLRAQGLRTGLHTSPHLHHFVERVRIDGAPIDDDLAASLAAQITDAIADGTLPSLTFFEAVTLLGWRAFERARVDLAVLEVGLGGRLDATTVCAPKVTVITRIAFDHMALLGGTLDAIAREKAGIVKPGVPCVLGPDLHPSRNAEARAAIEQVAAAVRAPLVDAPPFSVEGDTVRVRWRGADTVLRPSLPGPWHAENLATAVGALDALADAGVSIAENALQQGVSSVRWAARTERLGDVLFDAAHNPDGLAALVDALPSVLHGARVGAVIFGVSRDKDHPAMASLLARIVDRERWFMAAADMPRAATARELTEAYGGTACDSPADALARARAAVAPGEVVVVCGSIFLVAAVRAAVLGIEQDPSIPM